MLDAGWIAVVDSVSYVSIMTLWVIWTLSLVFDQDGIGGGHRAGRHAAATRICRPLDVRLIPPEVERQAYHAAAELTATGLRS
jgi:hypothetical protein